MSFSIVWYVEHKTGPEAGLGSFGVASWMVGLFALIITVQYYVWFAASKD
jgi:hypothetical protein